MQLLFPCLVIIRSLGYYRLKLPADAMRPEGPGTDGHLASPAPSSQVAPQGAPGHICWINNKASPQEWEAV